MKISTMLSALSALGADYYTGVPDSQLSPLCDYLISTYGFSPENHIVAANEGGAVGLAAGHYLATGRPAVVYLQNSGLGNIVNPVCSLVHEKVYSIPMVFIVGWRGQPGVNDEPQHIFQGEITRELLDLLEIPHAVIEKGTTEAEFTAMMEACGKQLAAGKQFAFVVTKGALESEGGQKHPRDRDYPLSREQALTAVINSCRPGDIFVSTTGKLSRELFELRERLHQGHGCDFLTVGSMGHSLMIAAGVATGHPDRRVFCLDGDGAVLMHQGAMAVAAAMRLENLTHVLFNNSAHESVGGIPTVGDQINFVAAAQAAGYHTAYRAETEEALYGCLTAVREKAGPHFLEIKINLKVRSDLGRPTTTPQENKRCLMRFLEKEGTGE